MTGESICAKGYNGEVYFWGKNTHLSDETALTSDFDRYGAKWMKRADGQNLTVDQIWAIKSGYCARILTTVRCWGEFRVNASAPVSRIKKAAIIYMSSGPNVDPSRLVGDIQCSSSDGYRANVRVNNEGP